MAPASSTNRKPSTKQSQGGLAVKSGQYGEKTVQSVLLEHGYVDVTADYKTWRKANVMKRLVTTQDIEDFRDYARSNGLLGACAGFINQPRISIDGIFGDEYRIPDGLVLPVIGAISAVEVKQQTSQGSAVEKVDGIAFTLAEHFPAFNVYCIYDGGSECFLRRMGSVMIQLQKDRQRYPGFRANFFGFQSAVSMINLIAEENPTDEQKMNHFVRLVKVQQMKNSRYASVEAEVADITASTPVTVLAVV